MATASSLALRRQGGAASRLLSLAGSRRWWLWIFIANSSDEAEARFAALADATGLKEVFGPAGILASDLHHVAAAVAVDSTDPRDSEVSLPTPVALIGCLANGFSGLPAGCLCHRRDVVDDDHSGLYRTYSNQPRDAVRVVLLSVDAQHHVGRVFAAIQRSCMCPTLPTSISPLNDARCGVIRSVL